MPFAAALSTAAPAGRALDEVCSRAAGPLGGTADLAVLFFSADHVHSASEIFEGVQQRLAPRCLLGCVAESVVGDDREVEQGPALSLWLARWSRPVAAESFTLTLERTADGPSLL